MRARARFSGGRAQPPQLCCLGLSAGLLVCPVVARRVPPASSPPLLIMLCFLLGFLAHLQASLSVGSVWTVLSSDLQRQVGKATDQTHAIQATLPPQGHPHLLPVSGSRLGAILKPPSPPGRSRPSAALLILTCLHFRVFHHSVCGVGRGCFFFSCKSSHLSGPRAFPAASVYSTPAARAFCSKHTPHHLAPSFPKLPQRQKPGVAQES